ncbi:HipA domain-containing protein [Xanthocytophaga flava]|uniref:HipA domain-containing protein n=1 Tax=Xanthocytophaga flava TaxID=3048013 RepID=UPI0028D6852F|nr:HipA domain-containing protein [Xanthocytophaga flavus]
MKCPGCLKTQPQTEYCRKCITELFDGHKVSPFLSFESPYKEESNIYSDLTKKISISGVQIKYSIIREKNTLRLTEKGGQYILKPIPIGQFRYLDQAPANEHLTMQIARQLFKINVPPNAVVYFKDTSPAYLVKRFDVRADGLRFQQEDFAQIAQVTEYTHGQNYKYDLSYEQIGQLIKKYIASYPIEIEKFFRMIIFNYVFSNGDAHVKNFSAIRTLEGDYILAPAYDLLCTRIHVPSESDMALMLFTDTFTTAYDAYGFYTRFDFLQFGKVLGLKESRIIKILSEFTNRHMEVIKLIDNSLLKDEVKHLFKTFYEKKVNCLQMEWTEK